VDETIQRQLRGQLPADVAQLKDRLEFLAAERAERARGQLSKRADDEANAFVKVLQEQRERILKTRTKHDSEFEQLAFGFLISNKAPQTGAGALAAVCRRCRQ